MNILWMIGYGAVVYTVLVASKQPLLGIAVGLTIYMAWLQGSEGWIKFKDKSLEYMTEQNDIVNDNVKATNMIKGSALMYAKVTQAAEQLHQSLLGQDGSFEETEYRRQHFEEVMREYYRWRNYPTSYTLPQIIKLVDEDLEKLGEEEVVDAGRNTG